MGNHGADTQTIAVDIKAAEFLQARKFNEACRSDLTAIHARYNFRTPRDESPFLSRLTSERDCIIDAGRNQIFECRKHYPGAHAQPNTA